MKELFCRYLNEQCSLQEIKELLACFSAEDESVLRALIRTSLEDKDAEDKNEESPGNPVPNKIFAAIKTQINSEKENAMVRVRTKL